MESINSYKKTVIYAVILTIICSVLAFVYEFRIQNSILESFVESFILVAGLILFPKFEKNNNYRELTKGILITLIYGIIIANFIQVINPTSDSELKTVISFLLFSLTYNYIILVGLTVILLKFAYNTITRKRIVRQEKE